MFISKGKLQNGLWVLFLIMLAIPLVGMGARPAGEIIIGSTLPLSGDAAAWGKNTQKGIELALKEINDSGGVMGSKIFVSYEDTQALPKEGVSAYRKLVSINKVPAIIDDSVSGVTLAMAPLAQKDHVVILATGATSPKISEAGDYIFRIWNSDVYEGEVTVDHAFNTLGLRSVAILYINNEYGKGLEQVFTTQFNNIGGSVPISEAFAQGATDIRTQISKIQAAKPDGLYLVGYPKEIPIALRQAKELGLTVTLLGTVANQDPQLIQSAGDAAEGLMFPYPIPPSGMHVASFNEMFKRKYGEDPGITSDVGYDAIKMIAEAMRLAGGITGAHVQRGLTMIKNYHGVSGVMDFDSKGDVHKPMGIKTVKNGKFVWMD